MRQTISNEKPISRLKPERLEAPAHKVDIQSLSPAARAALTIYNQGVERACAFRELRAAFNASVEELGLLLGLCTRDKAKILLNYEAEPILGKTPKYQPDVISRLCQNLKKLAQSETIDNLRREHILKAQRALLRATIGEYEGSSLGILRKILYEYGEASISKASKGAYDLKVIRSACDRKTMIPFEDLLAIVKRISKDPKIKSGDYEALVKNEDVVNSYKACRRELVVSRCWQAQLADLRLHFNLLGFSTTERALKKPAPQGPALPKTAALGLATGNLIFWPQIKKGIEEFLVKAEYQQLCTAEVVKQIKNLKHQVNIYYETQGLHKQFHELSRRTKDCPVLSRHNLKLLLDSDEFAIRAALRGYSVAKSCSRAALTILLSKSSDEASTFIKNLRDWRYQENRRVSIKLPDQSEIERDIWGLTEAEVNATQINEDREQSNESVNNHDKLRRAEKIQKIGIDSKLRPALLDLLKIIDTTCPAEVAAGALFIKGSFFALEQSHSATPSVMREFIAGTKIPSYEKHCMFLELTGRASDPVLRGIWQEEKVNSMPKLPALYKAVLLLADELYGSKTGLFRAMFGEAHHPEITWKIRLDKLHREEVLPENILTELTSGLKQIPTYRHGVNNYWSAERVENINIFLGYLNNSAGQLQSAIINSLSKFAENPSLQTHIKRLRELDQDSLCVVSKLAPHANSGTQKLLDRKDQLVNAIREGKKALPPQYHPDTVSFYEIMQFFPGVSHAEFFKALAASNNQPSTRTAKHHKIRISAEKPLFPITEFNPEIPKPDPEQIQAELAQYLQYNQATFSVKLKKVKSSQAHQLLNAANQIISAAH